MKRQVIKIRVLRWLRRIVLYGGYLTLVFFLSAFLIIQIPTVQENIIARYLKNFSEVSGFRITFNSIYLLWYDHLQINGLIVKDSENNSMITISDLSVNFRITSLFDNNNANIDGAAIDNAEVNLIRIKESDSTRNLNINIFINRLNEMLAKGQGGGSAKVNIGEIILGRSRFSYNDTDRDSIRRGFDYNHFKLSLGDAELENFRVIGDTIQFNVNSLSAVDEKTKFDIKSLQTFFRISQNSMEFLNLNLQAGKSNIADTVIFTFKSQRDLNDFNNKVSMMLLLKESTIHPSDLALFAPGSEAIAKPVTLSGKVSGRVTRLYYRDMNVRLGSTELEGKLDMDGLPAFNETFITLQLKKGNININDFRFALPEKVFERFKPLQQFSLNGTFTGFVNDFVANATLEGPIGKIQSDINLKVNEGNADRSTYRGNLLLTDFNLGTFFKDTTTYQLVSLQGHINGWGLSSSSANFLLAGSIQSLGILGYEYKNIRTNARLASQFFSGTISVHDPNLKFNAQGSIDFRNKNNLVKVKANLDTAQLQSIGLVKDELFLSSYIDINSRGLKIDSLFGDAVFRNTFVRYKDNSIQLDSVHLISEKADGERQITLRSSLLDASLKGNYYYSTMFNDLNKLLHELAISFKNDKEAVAAYYKQKTRSVQSYDANFEVHLHNINPLARLAGIDLQMAKNTSIQGRFSNGQTTILHASSHIDSLNYAGKTFFGNDIELTGSKVRDSANVLAFLTINSARQKLTQKLSTKNLSIEGIWNRDHIDLGLNVDQEGLDNTLRIRSEIDFLADSTRIKFLPSRIQVLEKVWEINEKNYVLFKGKEFEIHHLEAHHNQESVLVDGRISSDPDQIIKMNVNNLNLDILNSISSERFTGILNGMIEGKDFLSEPYVQNRVSVKDLTINDFLVGNINGTNEWNPDEKKFDINFSIDRLSERTVNLAGYYDPRETESPLSVEARFNKANLKILEPVMRGVFSQIQGELSGLYNIRGTFGKPAIQGDGTVTDGMVTIEYLKTQYQFNGKVGMTPSQITFRDFEIHDIFKNRGTLSGYIAHKNFGKFRLNLDGSFSNFQVLNTTTKDNNLFYGQGYATGNMNIFGPSSNLKISATARTEKNSRIFIPISGTETTEKKDFVTFTHFTDSIATEAPIKVNRQTELTGVTLDLNLDITPAAYAEIIFDIKAGDIIRGRGNGDIKLQLDTKGEFNMFGLIEFTEGAYNFTLYDIINKEFTIKPGSRITWFGDPYQGNLNITASYRQLTSLAPILSDQTLDNEPGIRRKYPVEVLLALEGPMLSPQINFDLQGVDLPDNVNVDGRPPVRLNFEFNAFKAKLDEQELKRQVFSLIVLRKLSPPDAFSTSGSVASSVSEFLTNQLSYWVTQVDQNLEIDIDLGALDAEAFNTFQLRLSYSFLNGRLRVTRDGTFTNQNQAQQSVATLAGDWTVDYLLTPDGKFKVKMYSRSNLNTLNSSLGAQNSLTTGFSLLHTQNFNEVKDLLRSARERRRKQVQSGEEEKIDETGGTH